MDAILYKDNIQPKNVNIKTRKLLRTGNMNYCNSLIDNYL